MKLEHFFTLEESSIKSKGNHEKMLEIYGKIFSINFIGSRYDGVTFRDLYTNEETTIDTAIGHLHYLMKTGKMDIQFINGDSMSFMNILSLCPTYQHGYNRHNTRYTGDGNLESIGIRRTDSELRISAKWYNEVSRAWFVAFIKDLGFDGGVVFPIDGFGEVATVWGVIFPFLREASYMTITEIQKRLTEGN